MIPQYIISFREGFEVLIIAAIIYGYLKKTNRSKYKTYLSYGIVTSVIVSIAIGISVYTVYTGLKIGKLVEIGGSFLAVGVLTYVVYTMASGSKEYIRRVRERIEEAKSFRYGLYVIGFIVGIREGVETIIFLLPFFRQDTAINNISGIILGILSSLILAYLIYRVGIELNLKKFFTFTSILLIFIASGILGYGIHELIEYFEDNGVELGPIGTYVYDLKLSPGNILHEKNVIGGILSTLFGYASKMEIIRLLIQGLYLITAICIYLRISKHV